MNEAQDKSVPNQDRVANSARRRRQRRDASQWRALLEQQRASGQTVKAFCAAHELSEASFYAWRRHLRQLAARPTEVSGQHAPDDRQQATPSVGFVRLDPQAGASNESIEVQFACGATLRCGSSHLAELVRTLKADVDGQR